MNCDQTAQQHISVGRTQSPRATSLVSPRPPWVLEAVYTGDGKLGHAIALCGGRAFTTKHNRGVGLSARRRDPEDSNDATGVTIARMPARTASAPTWPRGGTANGPLRNHESSPASSASGGGESSSSFTSRSNGRADCSRNGGDIRMMLLDAIDAKTPAQPSCLELSCQFTRRDSISSSR